MITCQQVTELVSAYVEGDLTTWERVRFRLHLIGCADCRAYVAQLQATVAAVGHLPELELPADLEAELVARFRGWHPGGPPGSSSP